eukprot:Plantae.Rhodophyta-Hildenbrandia_rubra.ctg5696.p1 GENE.Plantae.Rhodophyta-Hildenbrandia_rubra.ctg5696~~Plantae.Rhodophyta-Hildenbrandia_rubra.ctg5696.p1  ORF type:complete len:814 (-),score=159.78 Plantae.Rhodophyta-Hildenbrandia_rubra.ctg5696:2994-5435(-)
MAAVATTPPPIPSKITYILRPRDGLHRFGVSSLALTPDLLFTGGRDGVVRSWAVTKDGYLVGEKSGHSSKVMAAACREQLDEHSDWVNGLVYLNSHRKLVSCSSDTTLKVWGFGKSGMGCLETLEGHTDYVKVMDVLDEKAGLMVSGSLDGRILVWDLSRGKAVCDKEVAADHTGADDVAVGWSGGAGSVSKSVYALAAGMLDGPMVAAGGAHKFVHVWDLREDVKAGPVFSLASKRGGSTRALKIGNDGTLLAGGADSDMTMWDLKMGKSRSYFNSGHMDSVWAMQRGLGMDTGAEVVLTGGRDGRVCATRLDAEPRKEYGWNGKQVYIVKQADEDPRANRVLNLCATHDEGAVYVATTGSTVRLHRFTLPWRQNRSKFDTENGIRYKEETKKLSIDGRTSMNGVEMAEKKTQKRRATDTCAGGVEEEVVGEILGKPGIVRYKVANDRRRVVVMDSSGGVKIYDVTSGKVVEEYELEAAGGPGTKMKVYGKEQCEDELDKKWDMIVEQFEKTKEEEISIPSWFSVDIRTGSLGIKLEKSSVFNAEVYALEAGVQPNVGEDSADQANANGSNSGTKKKEETKVNIGSLVLKALFATWKENELAALKKKDADETNGKNMMEIDHGYEGSTGKSAKATSQTQARPSSPVKKPSASSTGEYRFTPEITVIVKRVNRPVPVLQKHISDINHDDTPLLPNWAVEAVRDNKSFSREAIKLSFSLTPAEGSNLPPLPQVNLTATRILRVRKVSSYVCQQLATLEKKDTENFANYENLSEDEVEILCGDRVLSPMMSLATARAFVWKEPEELKLIYRLKQK